ncbi:hypothetical protein P4H46_15310 [Paenibacillus glucanolyticus]
MKVEINPCVRCNFDDEFITDYKTDGTEYVFCGNCGQVVEPEEEGHE